MKRFTHKTCRRYGVKLCQSAKCPVLKRNYPPGVHGPSFRGQKQTAYGKQLAEKQKAKRIYGLREGQFRNYFDTAFKKVGNTIELLFKSLENRLDNTVYRLGLAATRSQARQLVSHGHITINGKKVDIPSYQVKVGEVIALSDKSLKSPLFENLEQSLQQKEMMAPWLTIDPKTKVGKVTGAPKINDVEVAINWSMIVEFYSR
jgi:small subunit ribosomal protein S4